MHNYKYSKSEKLAEGKQGEEEGKFRIIKQLRFSKKLDIFVVIV